MNKQEILRVLDRILDPDLRDRSIVEMGFVREDDIEVTKRKSTSLYGGRPPLPLQCRGRNHHSSYLEQKIQKNQGSDEKGHYQQDIVNQILEDESQFKEWFEKIKSESLGGLPAG